MMEPSVSIMGIRGDLIVCTESNTETLHAYFTHMVESTPETLREAVVGLSEDEFVRCEFTCQEKANSMSNQLNEELQ